MTRDPCCFHPTTEAQHVAVVRTTVGRAVYRLCDACAPSYTTRPLPRRVDIPTRKDTP